jgi:hypothetical protein
VQTITFYAYKGGTGRTLALANAAVYLARLKQRVFAIDLDLEAPGLHHKLALTPGGSLPPIERGIVDCIHTFVARGQFPEKLAPYTVSVPREEERDGPITLMPAGNVLSANYWRQLARLDWHKLFYSKEAEGVPFFLELKERIKAEFSPDFLLIDARTGITEVGGVATTLLPDQVFCLLLNNRENLEGAREVLRGIKRVSVERKKDIGIVPVLARIPHTRAILAPTDKDREQKLTTDVRAFLCESPNGQNVTMDLCPVFVLHTEESLAYEEALRIGGKSTVDESPLYRDYIYLFAQIIPSELVEPHLAQVIDDVTKGHLLENPDRVQGVLEALAVNYPHPASYLALLKFYRLRNSSPATILRTAVRYWEVSHRADHPLLQTILQDYYGQDRLPEDSIPHLGAFAYAVWDSSQNQDPTVGFRIVDRALRDGEKDVALVVTSQIPASASEHPELVIACINRLIGVKEYDSARSLIQMHSTAMTNNADFQVAQASHAVETADAAAARALFENQTIQSASILAKAPYVYVRLLKLAGREEQLDAALQSVLDGFLKSSDDFDLFSSYSDHLILIGSFFSEIGRWVSFQSRIEKSLPEKRVRYLLDELSKRDIPMIPF